MKAILEVVEELVPICRSITGDGVRKTLSAVVPAATARWAGLLPGLGLALAVVGVFRGFGALGALVAAGLVVVSSIALIVRAKDAADVLR